MLKYQENLTWVIMFSILMTFLTDKALILQWEIWTRSLLAVKGSIRIDANFGPEFIIHILLNILPILLT